MLSKGGGASARLKGALSSGPCPSGPQQPQRKASSFAELVFLPFPRAASGRQDQMFFSLKSEAGICREGRKGQEGGTVEITGGDGTRTELRDKAGVSSCFLSA